MARFSLTLAAATLAAGLGSTLAQAQSYPPASPMGGPMAPGMRPPVPMGQPPMAPMSAPTPYSQAPYPQAPSSQAPYSQGPSSQAPYSQAPSSQTPYSQGPSSQAPYSQGPAMTMDGRPVVPTPAQPFNSLSLPRQQVGDGAYNGGGVVLEYLPDGTRREVR
jgi:hypothetical protein